MGPRLEAEAGANFSLTRYELVVWTAGNVSARVPGQDLLVIKPSGVSYDDLTPENMVVCDLLGMSRSFAQPVRESVASLPQNGHSARG